MRVVYSIEDWLLPGVSETIVFYHTHAVEYACEDVRDEEDYDSKAQELVRALAGGGGEVRGRMMVNDYLFLLSYSLLVMTASN